MPIKSEVEKLKIPDELKRSIKLSKEQKEEVLKIRNATGLSQRKLADLFGVSRRTIQFILNKEDYERNKKMSAERHHKYYNPEKHKQYVKRTRDYRKELNESNYLIK